MTPTRRTGYVTLFVVGAVGTLAISSYGCSPDGDPPASATLTFGSCLSAQGSPALYVLDTAGRRSLVSDKLGLYWTSSTGVWMLPDGESAATQLDTITAATNLTTDGGYVYWVSSTDNLVRWFDRETRAVSSTHLLSQTDRVYSFAMDARYFYTVTYPLVRGGGGLQESTLRISRTPLRAGGPVEIVYTAPFAEPSVVDAQFLAANGALYWIAADGLRSLPNGASSSTLLAAFDGAGTTGLHVDARAAYWFSAWDFRAASTRILVGLLFDGSTTIPVASFSESNDYVMDDDFIYFNRGVSIDGSVLRKIDRSTFAESAAGSREIAGAEIFAVDHENIYWVDTCNPPSIRKTAK